MTRGVTSGAEVGSEVEEAEDAEEAQEAKENRGWRFAASRLVFDDVIFSRIALTTIALCGGVPIGLTYRKGPGEKESRDEI